MDNSGKNSRVCVYIIRVNPEQLSQNIYVFSTQVGVTPHSVFCSASTEQLQESAQ